MRERAQNESHEGQTSAAGKLQAERERERGGLPSRASLEVDEEREKEMIVCRFVMMRQERRFRSIADPRPF